MKTAADMEPGYRCIECGHACMELYHSYCDGVVKLMHCVMIICISINPSGCWCCWFGIGCWYHAWKTKTQPSWEKDTPNPKLQGRQRGTKPAKIFPRHDMSKSISLLSHKPCRLLRMIGVACMYLFCYYYSVIFWKIWSQTDQDGDRIASENACQKPAGNSRGLKKYICSKVTQWCYW